MQADLGKSGLCMDPEASVYHINRVMAFLAAILNPAYSAAVWWQTGLKCPAVWTTSHRLMCLKVWSPAGGTVWIGCGTFRRGLNGSESLGALWLPAPNLPTCSFRFLTTGAAEPATPCSVASLSQPRGSLPFGSLSQNKSSSLQVPFPGIFFTVVRKVINTKC